MSWVREPVVHFVVLGALLLALDRALAGGDADETLERSIVVDDAVRAELADGWQHAHGAPPSQAELDALVARWIDDEILYREALERGLERDDPQVRARLASNMGYVLDAQALAIEPSEDELRAHFDAHRDAWAQEALIDFTHVFVSNEHEDARARAEALLAQVTAGASPSGLGDTFSGGRRYRRRRIVQLEESFGAEFARGLEPLEQGAWALVPSRFGWHVVRVDGRSAASDADFDAVREDVLHDLREQRTIEARARELSRLRERWDVVVR
ncbi:peptidyl-prolyl cis-trans isomerase [Sandaracinus amylolyticus]|uniref:peptidylprolyl isomerase n=1 Tax=Sandaracinus amylolyticus TaxID=927083 RepID=UPI001F37310D|nr:peptidylprolyl isomerase [Sandaracinus amylolyticus]UJR78557.1 PpiC domain-containing protein [Sandaracinus amylolyticus]